MGAGPRAKSLRGECVSDAPGRGSEGQKTQSKGPGSFSREPGHPAFPSQGPLDTFPPAALRKQTRHCAEHSSVCAPVEYGHAPSTGYLSTSEFRSRGCPPSTFRKQGTPSDSFTVQLNRPADWKLNVVETEHFKISNSVFLSSAMNTINATILNHIMIPLCFSFLLFCLIPAHVWTHWASGHSENTTSVDKLFMVSWLLRNSINVPVSPLKTHYRI